MAEKKEGRVVVTGATGLIGGNLIERLLARGNQVTAFVRNPGKDRGRLPGAITLVRWNAGMTDGDWVEALDGADAVVNLAGAPLAKRWNEAYKKTMYSSRVEGTRHIVEAISRVTAKPRVLVNGSAVGYYGIMRKEPVAENASKGNDFLADLCAAWEAEAVNAEAYGVRTALVRTGLVLAPGGGNMKPMFLAFRAFLGGPVGSGDQPFPWIHIDDEVGIILKAIDDDNIHGPLNAAAPDSVNNAAFSRTLGKVMGRPSWLPVPEFALRLLFGEAADILVGGQAAVPERTLETGYQFSHPSLEPALRDLFG